VVDDSPSFTLEDARRLAHAAHEGQTDKLGAPYVEHVEAVAAGLADFDLEIQIAGMLHDVVEDTDITVDELRSRGVSERSLAAIALVSRNLHPDLDYAQGIEQITTSPDATLVKISDNAHNSRPDRAAALERVTGEPINPRYAAARRVLYAVAPAEDIAKILRRAAPQFLQELDATNPPEA
jgi:(p)ppGpp synthase/HD superfamily hydrolase